MSQSFEGTEAVKSRSTGTVKRKDWGLIASALIPLAFLLLFYVFPIIIMFVYSFWKIDEIGNLYPAWNLRQYSVFFKNPVYAQLLFKSLKLAVSNTLISLVIAYPLAYYIAKVAKKKWRYLLLFLIILPSWTSFLVRTYAWVLLLGEKGFINYFLMNLGIISEPLQLAFTPKAVLISLVHIYLPYMVLPIFNSLEKINYSLIEAAECLGANKLQTFLKVILRLSLPGVVSGSIIVLIPSVGEYVIPMILGGNKGMMYSNAVTSQFMITNWPLGAALAFILFAVVMLIFMLYSKFMKIEELWSGF